MVREGLAGAVARGDLVAAVHGDLVAAVQGDRAEEDWGDRAQAPAVAGGDGGRDDLVVEGQACLLGCSCFALHYSTILDGTKLCVWRNPKKVRRFIAQKVMGGLKFACL